MFSVIKTIWSINVTVSSDRCDRRRPTGRHRARLGRLWPLPHPVRARSATETEQRTFTSGNYLNYCNYWVSTSVCGIVGHNIKDLWHNFLSWICSSNRLAVKRKKEGEKQRKKTYLFMAITIYIQKNTFKKKKLKITHNLGQLQHYASLLSRRWSSVVRGGMVGN